MKRKRILPKLFTVFLSTVLAVPAAVYGGQNSNTSDYNRFNVEIGRAHV